MELVLVDVRQEPDRVRNVWRELSNACEHSFYLSWGWVENWLESVRDTPAQLKLAVLSDREVAIAVFFLGMRRRLGGRRLFVNATGYKEIDRLYIEFNSILCRDAERCHLRDLMKYLPEGWDEVVLPGMDVSRFPGNQLQTDVAPYWFEAKRDTPAYFVDLDQVRENGDYLSRLSRNTRSQIRRSYRRYSERGEVRFEVASTPEEAAQYFEELMVLHQGMWSVRSRRSNFAIPFAVRFHRRLIEKRYLQGDIQLARLCAGEETIGVLYNFAYCGSIYCYQSGFRYEEDNRLKPGMMAHAEAVAFNADRGARTYELLAGDSQYKSALGTGEKRLVWGAVQRPSVGRWLKRRLKRAKAGVAGCVFRPGEGQRQSSRTR